MYRKYDISIGNKSMKQLSFPELTPGYCYCGCGQKTPIAPRNRTNIGWIKGEPLKYVVGHSRKMRGGPAVPFGKKWCCRCRRVKSITDFYKNKQAARGLQGICKDCTREASRQWRTRNRIKDRQYAQKHRLREKFGITIDHYQALLDQQGGKCAICNGVEQVASNGISRLMAVDHNHDTGSIRGILCTNCNRAIGLLHDDPVILQKAIAYLTRAR
jgi:hypothetical protein